MIHRDPIPDTLSNRVRAQIATSGGEVVRWGWHHIRLWGAIGPNSKIAARFGAFGEGSSICWPGETLVNPQAIHIGRETVIAPHVALSAGWAENEPMLPERVVTIGDRCLIGRGSTVIGHRWIEIGNDVWTGHFVHITDMNHGYEDVERPISVQHQPEKGIYIGDGSWLGHGVVVLPGVHIGKHVVVGAGSVVTTSIPDFSVAVGAPARVIRRFDPDAEVWSPVARSSEG